MSEDDSLRDEQKPDRPSVGGSPVDEWTGPLASDLDELQAFDAMREFLEAWWKRGGKPEGDALWLLSACDRDVWADGGPSDPAMWSDWLEAVAKVRARA